MKKRTPMIWTVLAVLLVVGGVAAWQWRPIARADLAHCVRRGTIDLPRCDRVEVSSLSGDTGSDAATGFPVRPYAAFSRILDRKTLTGQDAEALVAVWRSQEFGHRYQSMCHRPAFGLRFYRGSSLTFETSVWFRCRNFYVPVLGTAAWWGMDSKAPSATSSSFGFRRLFQRPSRSRTTRRLHMTLQRTASPHPHGGIRASREFVGKPHELSLYPVNNPFQEVV
ncbi:MAG: hypothetical protein ACKPGI_07040 [Verrucomicrobiota bacterium]